MIVQVQYQPVEYKLQDDEWKCQHHSTHIETVEDYDEYREAVTDELSVIFTYFIDVCDTCEAWYNSMDGGWQDESNK